MTSSTKERRKGSRKWLSISERNSDAMEILENTQVENGLTFSPAIFHTIRDHERLKRKIQNSNWAIVREML